MLKELENVNKDVRHFATTTDMNITGKEKGWGCWEPLSYYLVRKYLSFLG